MTPLAFSEPLPAELSSTRSFRSGSLNATATTSEATQLPEGGIVGGTSASPEMDRLPPMAGLPSPCYVIDLQKLRQNMRLLQEVQERAGCKILLALKGFSTWSAFPEMRPFLAGCCASGVWEARLGRDEFGGEVHSYSPAFSDADFEELLGLSDHITFNSVSQWDRFRPAAHAHAGRIEFGLRINAECSTGRYPMYDPCAPHSRLGITAAQLEGADLTGITGFHSHTLCQQGAEALEFTLAAIEENFGRWLPQLKWFNMGGGHHITKPGYDIERLIRVVRAFSEKWGVEVYLEPGEAHVLGVGSLCSTVLDVTHNGMDIGILDVSATAHMPDVLEMPYRPPIAGSGKPGEKLFTYRLGAATCLSGDVFGDYSFDLPLTPGDRLVFRDQAQYTMVKTTMFNGVKHPAIALWDSEDDSVKIVREFDYDEFKARLG